MPIAERDVSCCVVGDEDVPSFVVGDGCLE